MVRDGVSEEQRFSAKGAAVGGCGAGGRAHRETMVEGMAHSGIHRASPAHGQVTRTGAETEQFREAS